MALVPSARSTRRALRSAMVIKHAVDGLAAQAEVEARLPQLLSVTQGARD